ncbi:subtilase [Apiospora saccharicola]
MLSASASIADLHAFIQASSLLYRVFLLFKTAILLEVSGRDEGIVVRDYVAFSQVEFRGRFDDDYLDKTLKNIQRYQSLPPGRKATTVGVTARQAAYIIDFSRTVRFFIDLFTSNRFPILEAFVGQEAAAAPLSPGGICLLFCVGRDRGDGDGDDTDAIDTDAIDTDAIVRRRFFGLFAPWEMEQVAAAHAFVFSVHRAWGKCTPKAERILDSERAQPLHQGERACLMTLLDAGRVPAEPAAGHGRRCGTVAPDANVSAEGTQRAVDVPGQIRRAPAEPRVPQDRNLLRTAAVCGPAHVGAGQGVRQGPGRAAPLRGRGGPPGPGDVGRQTAFWLGRCAAGARRPTLGKGSASVPSCCLQRGAAFGGADEVCEVGVAWLRVLG